MANETEIHRLMDQAAEALLKPLQEPIRIIYIDSDFLYDYRLGSLILKLSTQEQYDYMLKHLSEYMHGSSRKITKYFPDLKLTEHELDLLEDDPQFSKLVPVAAPATEFANDLPSFIARINTYNHNRDMAEPLKIIVNQRKHKIPDKIWLQLIQYVRQLDKQVVFSRTNYRSWSEVDAATFDKIDILFAFDLVDFMSQRSVAQQAIANNKCNNKILVSYLQVEKDPETPEEEKEMVTNFVSIMKVIFLGFAFIYKNIPINIEGK